MMRLICEQRFYLVVPVKKVLFILFIYTSVNETGCMKPYLVLGPMKSISPNNKIWGDVKYRYLNAVLGALQGLYTVRIKH